MRRVAFALMIAITGWSLWAWAEPMRHDATHAPAAMGAAAAAQRPAGPGGAQPGHAEARGEQAGGEQGKAEQGEAESEGPPSMNWLEFGRETPPFIAMIINFAILAGGYYLLGRKPIAAALHNRRQSVAREIEEAARMQREAEERAKVYQAKLDRLDDEMKTAREALLRAGEAERERIVAEAEATGERMRRDAEFLVEQEVKQIRQDLWREALQTAVTAAEEILKRRVTSADQERLAEDYLTDLGRRQRGSAPAAASHPPAGHEAENVS